MKSAFFGTTIAVAAACSVLSVAQSSAAEDVDTIFYAVERRGADNTSIFNLTNLFTRSVASGLTANGARTGLGTEYAAGEPLATDGLYYQGARIYSFFDWEFQRLLHSEPGPLPESVTMVAGRFHEDLVAEREDEQLQEAQKFRRIAALTIPEVDPFTFRHLLTGDVARQAYGSREAQFTPELADSAWEAGMNALCTVARDTYEPYAAPVRDKLLSMLDAYSPLATVYHAGFGDEDRDNSYTRLKVYTPAFHTLVADDVDYPETWYLEKGLARTELPEPIPISIAEITHVSYLEEADQLDDQIMSIELQRDFEETDLVTMVARFGVMRASESGSLLGIDTADYRNGVNIGYRVHWRAEDDDYAITRALKRFVNYWANSFDFEARVHELTLELSREGGRPDGTLRPHFVRDQSHISFRVARNEGSWWMRWGLRAMGFTCEENNYCWQDFDTWNPIVAFATQSVLAFSISNIEDAIDSEIDRLADDVVERVLSAKRTLTTRLHDGLFEEVG